MPGRSLCLGLTLLGLAWIPGTVVAAGNTAPALMPYPVSAHMDGSALRFEGGFDVRWSAAPTVLLSDALGRFRADAARLTGLDEGGAPAVSLSITCCAATPDEPAAGGGVEEAYTLRVDEQGVQISADTPVGVLRALATLRQLIVVQDGRAQIAHAVIGDAPRFAWRGLMIDVARHFMAVPTLERQIDAMERVKLNVLHLHLSDNEAFRVQSRRYPRLTQGNQGRFYTQEQIRDLVGYARARGIRVIPEIDLPGHAKAMIAAYPLLASGPVDAAIPGGPAIDVSKTETYVFLRNLLNEVASLFPDRYFHIGGDEVNGADWMDNPRIADYMSVHRFADKEALQEHFLLRLKRMLADQGKKVIGWEEIESAHMPEDVVVQVWKSSGAIDRATRRGHQVIVSAGYYLDHLWPTAWHYRIDPLDPAAFGYLSAADRQEMLAQHPELARMMTQDMVRPAGGTELTAEQQQRVIGAEAPLWSELVTDEMLDGRIWPRTAALAERFWSSAEVNDTSDMYRRLAVVQDQLRVQGLEDAANAERMLARLAPGRSAALSDLVAVTVPVRNFAHMNKIRSMVDGVARGAQTFNTLADAALPESLEAASFNLAAASLRQGDLEPIASLRARMQGWRADSQSVQLLVREFPGLQSVAKISADVAMLMDTGLEALAKIQSGQAPDAAWLADARAMLERHVHDEQASASMYAVLTSPDQPTADLLLAIVPGVRDLVETSASLPKQGEARHAESLH
ncbi:family 20 glycosylhydrolase [Pseudoxanthomonas sp.]|uniref:beta-N-acetylhexosaminidase n=1 Tax=Pseudoxanthomonas sp. TaxID=1871049 RepID=UPI00263923FA|nr:family 20 glycosylhydrolase [Pseudoxanthomonas sp.]WDS35441.1 MAG: family 20 glycosylhydrolase [Pseudoxanthomonas sp.]